MPSPGFIPLSDSELNVRAQNIAPLQDGASLLGSGPTHYMPQLQLSPNATILQAIGAVFFRRSRLFFREAAFFSGGEGCEWRAQRATVSREWGYNGENSFSALSPFVGARKGSSPNIPAPDFLFSSIHPKPPSHQIKQPLSKIAVNERAAIIDHLVAAS